MARDPSTLRLGSLGNRVARWQQQVSALHGRLISVQDVGLRQIVVADAMRLRREIASGLDLSRHEWEAMNVPAVRRATIERSCLQMIEALKDIEVRSGPSTLGHDRA